MFTHLKEDVGLADTSLTFTIPRGADVILRWQMVG